MEFLGKVTLFREKTIWFEEYCENKNILLNILIHVFGEKEVGVPHRIDWGEHGAHPKRLHDQNNTTKYEEKETLQNFQQT